MISGPLYQLDAILIKTVSPELAEKVYASFSPAESMEPEIVSPNEIGVDAATTELVKIIIFIKQVNINITLWQFV